jgi:hypothetical protein
VAVTVESGVPNGARHAEKAEVSRLIPSEDARNDGRSRHAVPGGRRP